MKTTRLALVLAFGCSLSLASAQPKGGGASPAGVPGMGNGPAGAPGLPRPAPSVNQPTAPATPTNPTAPASPASAAPAAQQLSSSLHDVNQAAYAERRQLIDSVDMRLKTGRESLQQLQANSQNLRADTRAEFMASLETAKARERDLNAAMQASRDADENSWAIRRSALTRAEQDFTEAMTHLQAIAPGRQK